MAATANGSPIGEEAFIKRPNKSRLDTQDSACPIRGEIHFWSRPDSLACTKSRASR
jgi:hypothetical protein